MSVWSDNITEWEWKEHQQIHDVLNAHGASGVEFVVLRSPWERVVLVSDPIGITIACRGCLPWTSAMKVGWQSTSLENVRAISAAARLGGVDAMHVLARELGVQL